MHARVFNVIMNMYVEGQTYRNHGVSSSYKVISYVHCIRTEEVCKNPRNYLKLPLHDVE